MRILTFILICIASTSYGQELVTDLNGFRLGQFRDVPKIELNGLVQHDKFEDGFENEIYLVEKDTSVYMIFEYANYDLQSIWSIQLTGYKPGYDCSFKGLKLGMSSNEIESLLGAPSVKEDIGEYGEKWVYNNTNFTLEISPNDNLAGIKIIDMSHDFYAETDITKIPSFKQYSEILKSNNREKIAALLAPGMEVYKNDSVFYFKNSIASEIDSDNSSIFKLAGELASKLERINPKDTLQYEENIRVAYGQDTKHVVKLKVDGVYSEIVFKYMFGRYLIWEITIN
jgi:hypothetical protein